MASNNRILVTFILPHKGRDALLKQTVQSIHALDFDQKALEIIVVTQNTTLEIPSRLQNVTPPRIIFRPAHETVATLRNIGARHASGAYFAFVDADVQLSSNWLSIMLETLQAKANRLLVSAVRQSNAETGAIGKMCSALWNSSSADNAVELLSGANLFLRRETFDQVGGFPEDFVSSEDYFLTNAVHQHGEVYCSSQACWVHLGDDKHYREMFRKEIWRAQGNSYSAKRRTLTLRELPGIMTPIWQFVCLGMAAFFMGTGKLTASGLALMMCGLPILVHALRLYRLGRGSFRLIDAISYYSVYFPARVIGTVRGVFRVKDAETLYQ